jgi:hypothetical protein
VGWIAASASTLATLFPDAFLAYFLWRFVLDFPRRLHFGPADTGARWAERISGALGVLFFTANALLPLVAPDGPAARALTPFKRGAGSLYWLCLSVLCLLAPLIAWVRARGAESGERARVRWFLGGLALGFSPLFLTVAAEALVPAFARLIDRPAVRAGSGLVLFAFLLTIPITSTYAVVAHRVLTLRVVVHRAVVFALARGTLLLAALLPTIGLARHLYDRRNLPLDAIFASREAALWVTVALVAWTLYAARRPLLRRLERWLIGSRRDPASALADYANAARRATSVEQLAGVTREHVAGLLGASRGALLLPRGFDAGDAASSWSTPRRGDTSAVFVPIEGETPSLAADSGIVRIALAGTEPIPLDPRVRESLVPWLLHTDRDWLHDSATELVAPLTKRGGELCGLLALGPARGGLPYRSEDRQALAATSATASLALERLLASGPESRLEAGLAGECVWCGNALPRPEGRCECGGAVTTAALPFELAGKFRLERVLGSGGMGVVYRAVDLELGRSVALKTLPRLKGGALERLRREARSMATFVHPNLALLFGLESWQDVPVLVVEYLGGGSLASRLPPGLPERLALQIAADIAGALDAMHRQGLLHRDVKPHNIAFAADGTPKLLDFGLAHLAAEGLAAIDAERDQVEPTAEERLTRSGAVVGTPLYLSPEILRGEPPSPAQDLWSLHLVLWESLTGEHPLARLGTTKALRRLRAADLPFHELRAAGVSEGVVNLLSSGLARDASRRPRTAGQARETLLAETSVP